MKKTYLYPSTDVITIFANAIICNSPGTPEVPGEQGEGMDCAPGRKLYI